jgi:NitT/TauT family transport system substrate-binding protein
MGRIRTTTALAALLGGVLAGSSALLAGCAGTTAASGSEAATSAAPSVTAEPPATMRIASLKGPTTMGLVHLMSQAEAGTIAQDYQVTMYASPDEVVPKVAQGQVDVALVPANLASVLYHRTAEDPEAAVQVLAANTLGMLEVLEAGETIDHVADLAGRTVYSTGKGASPELVLEHILTENGIDPETDVTVEYRSEATEVAGILTTTPGAVGVLPQPFVTVLQAQHPEIRTALDLNDAWNEVSPDSEIVTGAAIVRRAFAQEHPQAVADFLADYEASTEFTNEHPDQAAPLIVAAGIVPSTAVAEAAIPRSHIVFIAGAELRTILGGYLEVLAASDPASVGGSVPGDDFYYDPDDGAA